LDPVLDDLGAVAGALTYREPAIHAISPVSGRRADRWTDPEYWVEQVRATVRFHAALSTARDEGVRTLV
jgi:acyl transferase domain-containing protein